MSIISLKAAVDFVCVDYSYENDLLPETELKPLHKVLLVPEPLLAEIIHGDQ
jgi:hypothetical protein